MLKDFDLITLNDNKKYIYLTTELFDGDENGYIKKKLNQATYWLYDETNNMYKYISNDDLEKDNMDILKIERLQHKNEILDYIKGNEDVILKVIYEK